MEVKVKEPEKAAMDQIKTDIKNPEDAVSLNGNSSRTLKSQRSSLKKPNSGRSLSVSRSVRLDGVEDTYVDLLVRLCSDTLAGHEFHFFHQVPSLCKSTPQTGG